MKPRYLPWPTFPLPLGLLLTLLAFSGGAATARAQTYTTSFDREEAPLSEGGQWRNDGLDWTSVRQNGGRAFGTQTGTNTGPRRFDD